MTQRKRALPTSGQAPENPAAKATLLTKEQEGKTPERILAELALSPILPNANIVRIFGKVTIGELDLIEAAAVMREKASAVHAGNLAGLEETLTSQAMALNAIFNETARRAALHMGEHINAAEIYLRIGLKAQAQCRATLETLFEMKNPRPVAFVKQANIANGPQQVNNGVPPVGSPSHTETPAHQSNELLELNHEQRLDTRTKDAAGGAHSQLETVDAIQRSQD
jgi:hypothetical protein